MRYSKQKSMKKILLNFTREKLLWVGGVAFKLVWDKVRMNGRVSMFSISQVSLYLASFERGRSESVKKYCLVYRTPPISHS